jgi:hypothetical protein
MTIGPYPAALAATPAVHGHFVRHVEAARAGGDREVTPPPDEADIEAVITTGFWASLRREEGYVPKISLAFLPPQQTRDALRFDRPLRLDPAVLARVAPAVERPGIHLGVWPDAGGLCVWGATHLIPALCFVLEVAAPGLLVIKHQQDGDGGKFVNVAVLEGDQVKLIDENASSLPDCPELVKSLLGFHSPASWLDSVNVLVQLAASMRAHGRGGLLLVVPHGSDEWRESIMRPIPYALDPMFSGLAELMQQPPDARRLRGWLDAMERAVAQVAGVTAVDGATVLTDRYDVLAFGAKIVRRRGSPTVEEVTLTEPIVGNTPAVVHSVQLGGTRHLSAAQFAHDQHGAVALVASQDGPFTVFAWSPCEGMVHAHRVEALLL